MASIKEQDERERGGQRPQPLPIPACVNCVGVECGAPGGELLEQADFTGARPLGGVLDGELDALALAEQLEHGAPNGGPVEEVLDAAFVPNKSETLVD